MSNHPDCLRGVLLAAIDSNHCPTDLRANLIQANLRLLRLARGLDQRQDSGGVGSIGHGVSFAIRSSLIPRLRSA